MANEINIDNYKVPDEIVNDFLELGAKLVADIVQQIGVDETTATLLAAHVINRVSINLAAFSEAERRNKEDDN